MIDWHLDVAIYLHRDPVDFRKAINGLSVIVNEQFPVSAFSRSLFVFCNKGRDKLKVLYWDQTGFVLWHKRLEQDTFKWPRHPTDAVITLTHEQWGWLLRGFNYLAIQPHQALVFADIN